MNKKINRKLAILLFITVAFIFSLITSRREPFIGKEIYKKDFYVSSVIDGDTIELSNGQRVRYIGIDTPELKERNGSAWIYSPMPYAEEAKEFNKELVEGKSVSLEFDVQRRDRYGRLLGYVYIGENMVNLEIVRQGYAMIYTYPPNLKYVDEFVSAQKQAREDKKGLWADSENSIIDSGQAKDNIGLARTIETKVLSTYLSEKILILNCRHGFKIVIFENNLKRFPKGAYRSPETYFKGKDIRVYGTIKRHKGDCEIIVHDPSQLDILR